MFNVSQFLTTETTDVGSTSFIPVPDGTYTAVLKELKAGQGKNKEGQDSYWFDAVLQLDDADGSIKAVTGMEENRLQQRLFLDVTPSGGLDMSAGKNIGLNRIREALGQNRPGVAWSPAKMTGQVLRVEVQQKMDDSVSPPIMRARIKGFMSTSI